MKRKSEVLEWVDGADLPMLMAVICHLMTCYSVRPCPAIAARVEAHLRVLLEGPGGEELGGWRTNFEKLSVQWGNLARRFHPRGGVGEGMITLPVTDGVKH